MPNRIQRKRTKGWRMPPGAVYCGRPSKWGNPLDWRHLSRETAIAFYERWLLETASGQRFAEQVKAELADKDLVCWCPLSEPCHVDILLRVANGPEGMA